MTLFGNHDKNSLQAWKDVMRTSTLISPARDGFHTPRNTTSTVDSDHDPLGMTLTTQDDFSQPSQTSTMSFVSSSMGDLSLVDEITLSLSIRKKLQRIYHKLCGDMPLLSRGKFVDFLVHAQGETYVGDLKHEWYDAGKFLETWQTKYGCDALRPLGPEEKDLSRPLTNYFINSSHNTYLEGNQLASKSSPEAYRTVLSRGCRCIEIDVWNGDIIAPASPRSRSRSPRPEHRRGPSGNSFASAMDKLGDTVDHAWQKWEIRSNPHSHRGSPVADSRFGTSPRDSSMSLQIDPRDSGDRLDSYRPSYRSRSPYPRDEPIVTHGWTLTSACGFREVCQAIRDSAFEESDLPIIISLEVHADPSYQEVMVKIMKQEWGRLLIDEPLEGIDPRFRVPKLEEVRNRILVKVKRAQSKLEPPPRTSLSPMLPPPDDDASNSEFEEERPAVGQSLTAPTPMTPGMPLSPPPHVSTAPPPPPPPPQPSGSKKVPICENLAKLAIYTRSEHFKGFDTPEAKKPAHIFSVSENRILDELHTTKHDEMFTHNKNYFLRAFPAGRRIDSSNPDPSLFWRKGIQMVAMNWQYLDEGMMLNYGMFADERGWVLKPPGFRSTAKDVTRQADAATHKTLDLRITVLAGQHLYVPTGDDGDRARIKGLKPLVKCELHVEKPEERSGDKIEGGGYGSKGEYKQQTTRGRTDHPDFGEDGQTLQFLNIPKVIEELSFIRFKIEDDSRIPDNPVSRFMNPNLLAWSCLRLDRLREGYRFIRLLDPKARPIRGGKLLVKVEKTLR